LLRMSKKNKAKFKKQIKAQILEEIAKTETAAAKPAAKPTAPSLVAPKSQVGTTSASSAATIQNLAQIKYDLKKTAVVVAGLALAIVALVLLDQKYGILLKFGNILFQVFNIN